MEAYSKQPQRAFEIKIKKLVGQKYRGHSLKTESEKVPRAFAIMRNSESRDYLSAAATEHQLKPCLKQPNTLKKL